MSENSHTQVVDKREAPVRIVLPFKDQKSANVVREQLADLSRKINADISPVYTSRKIKDEIKVKQEKPPPVSQQSINQSINQSTNQSINRLFNVVNTLRLELMRDVFISLQPVWCSYVGYTRRHLHQRIEEHKGSAVGNHPREQHDFEPWGIAQSFGILRKCQNRFDCLIFEMFFH